MRLNTIIESILEELEEELYNVEFIQVDTLTMLEKSIEITLNKIKKMKEAVIQKGFSDQQEEICFFKTLKPLILSCTSSN